MKFKNITLGILTFLLCNLAYAGDLLDRLEVASEKIGASQAQFYVKRVPELADKLPSWEWDDEIRAASKCVLDGIADAKGADIAQAYVTGLEKDAERAITSLHQLSEQSSIPDVLQGDDQTIVRLTQRCRTLEISTERLKASGFWDAMLEPSVMQRLTAE